MGAAPSIAVGLHVHPQYKTAARYGKRSHMRRAPWLESAACSWTTVRVTEDDNCCLLATARYGSDLTGERSGPPPRLAVEGRSSGHGPMLPISDVDYVKSMLLPHEGWPMAAGPVSRLGSVRARG